MKKALCTWLSPRACVWLEVNGVPEPGPGEHRELVTHLAKIAADERNEFPDAKELREIAVPAIDCWRAYRRDAL
jgi:hypothetical protein